MNRFTRTGAAIAAAAAVTSLAACGGGDGGGSAASQSAEDAVTIGLDADAAPNGYDPLLYSQGQYQFFAGNGGVMGGRPGRADARTPGLAATMRWASQRRQAQCQPMEHNCGPRLTVNGR